ncbi:quinolinate synthase A [Deltaproteobacteria bacterium]|nr:quinolinate synthase A [Deltaproteobacteria bacterium]
MNEKKQAQLATVRALAGRHGVEILAHFYQRAEVKAAADFVGGSHEVVARALAAGAGRRVLVCGASFMAEALLAGRPRAEILVPRADLSCPLAEAVSLEEVAAARRRFPRALLVADIKARPEIKALADLEITPVTAGAQLSRLRGWPLLAVPGPQLVDWAGFGAQLAWRWPRAVCQVHELATAEDLAAARAAHPGALAAVNLLCRPEVRAAADFAGDSAGLRRFCAESRAGEFIVVSEAGLAEFLAAAMPDKRFHETEAELFCPNMKLTNLKSILALLLKIEDGAP